MPSLRTAKESPSGGEKLLRLLASGVAVSNEQQSKENRTNEQSINKMPLNFAQGTHFSIEIVPRVLKSNNTLCLLKQFVSQYFYFLRF